jgi:hypothetical protein
MPIPVRYHFTQRFSVSAKEAFDWCTDFDSQDHMLMGDKAAERQITYIADGVIILKDSFASFSGAIEKQKLVLLYPKEYKWTSTHLTGPNKHSQFLYQITPQGKDASVLTFTALHLEYDEKEDAKLLAERLCKEDAYAWKLLAAAMAEDKKHFGVLLNKQLRQT